MRQGAHILPIFPLSDVVLFPHIKAPLHIFEARYRQMVGHALAGDRRIAMVVVRPENVSEMTGDPPIYSVGCTGTSSGRNDLLGPVHGRSEVNYVVTSEGGSIEIDNVADVAQKLGRYRRLDYSESEKLRQLAQEKFDGFIVQEIERLRPAYESRRKKIRTQSLRQIARNPSQSTKILREEEVTVQKLPTMLPTRLFLSYSSATPRGVKP